MASRDEDDNQTKVDEIAKAALDDEAKGQYLTGRQMYWHTTVYGTAIGLLIVVMGIISFS
jgi:predicted cobalt transporter CbtA